MHAFVWFSRGFLRFLNLKPSFRLAEHSSSKYPLTTQNTSKYDHRKTQTNVCYKIGLVLHQLQTIRLNSKVGMINGFLNWVHLVQPCPEGPGLLQPVHSWFPLHGEQMYEGSIGTFAYSATIMKFWKQFWPYFLYQVPSSLM